MNKDVLVRKNILFSEALTTILQEIKTFPPETVPFNSSLGRVIAEDVYASESLPAQDISSRDGFAVRGGWLPFAEKEVSVSLLVVGRLDIKTKSDMGFKENEAVEVVTGTPLPPGTEAVIPVEDVGQEGNVIHIRGKFQKGSFIRGSGIKKRG